MSDWTGAKVFEKRREATIDDIHDGTKSMITMMKMECMCMFVGKRAEKITQLFLFHTLSTSFFYFFRTQKTNEKL